MLLSKLLHVSTHLVLCLYLFRFRESAAMSATAAMTSGSLKPANSSGRFITSATVSGVGLNLSVQIEQLFSNEKKCQLRGPRAHMEVLLNVNAAAPDSAHAQLHTAHQRQVEQVSVLS